MVEQTKTHKGFKKTDIGEIPEDWILPSYGDIFDFLTTATYSRSQLNGNGEIGYVHYGDIHTKHNFFLNCDTELPSVDKEQLKNYPFLKDGDIIAADASEDYAGVGKSVEVINVRGRKIISGLHTFLLRDRDDSIANGFKGYLHVNGLVKKQMDTLATGLKVYGVSKVNLKRILIPLPPTKEEQTAIATALRDTDQLINSLEKLIAKKQLIKQGAMQELLKPKEDWDVDTLGNIVEKITTGKLDANAMIANGEYRFYTCARDYYYINTYAFDDEALLISGNGENVGYVHYYKGKFNAYQRTYVLTGFLKNINFIKLYLDKYLPKRIETEVKSGNTPYITMTTLTDMKLFFPNEEQEQIRIATILSDMDTEIEVLEKKLAKYKLIKQGMMQNLLTGKIRLL